MEARPVHTTLVTLQNVLDGAHDVCGEMAQDAATALRRCAHLAALLLQPRNVPHADRLVQRGADDQVLLGMELRTHHVMVVARKHGDAFSALPIPDADVLVIRTTDNPRILRMELNGANIVEVSHQREKRTLVVVVPHAYLVVISSRDEERLRRVETTLEQVRHARQTFPATSLDGNPHSWICPSWREQSNQGRVGWNEIPFTRLLLVSNLASMLLYARFRLR